MLDIFRSDAFSLRSLTATMNDMPYVPTRLGDMGIFEERGINSLVATIEVRNNQLYLVQSQPRGARGNQNTQNGRKLIPLQSVHLPIEDALHADEIQGVRLFGSESQLETIQAKIAEKLTTMDQSLEATMEWHRIGAVKGKVLDADGTTVLYDLYDIFGVSKLPTISFGLTEANPVSGALRQKIHYVQRAIEDELGNGSYTGIIAMCGSAFMDKLVSHPEALKAYDRWNDGQMLRESFARRTFGYAGVLFEEYRGTVAGVKFIGDDDCEFFPVGVPGLFQATFSPANFLSTVNTVGLPKYATSNVKGEEYVELKAQSNPLHFCTRPRVLIHAVSGT